MIEPNKPHDDFIFFAIVICIIVACAIASTYIYGALK